MGFMRILGILLILACVPLLSQAAEVHMTSSTQYLWYQDILANESQGDVAEYLRLNVSKLDQKGNIGIYGYGRVTDQVTSSDEFKGRLYYMYLDYRNLIKDHLDLRAGRTYVHAEAVSGTIDGAHLNFKNLGPVGITLFGGREAIFANKEEIGGGNSMMGTSVYLDAPKQTHLEVSYGRKYRESEFTRENLGIDFLTTPIQQINFYGRAKYDTIGDKWSEILAGAKVAPIKDLTVRGEYYQSTPTFDRNSVYNFFSVTDYKEYLVAAEYALTGDYRFNAKYAHENFDLGAYANLYQAGLMARPIKDLTLNASYERRIGFAGGLSGIRFNGEYRIAKAALLAGIDYDDFEREGSRDDNARKYWGGVNYAFNKMFSAAVRAENTQSYLYSHYYQGFGTLNINF